MNAKGKKGPTILVPTDFSECSREALRRGVELARRLGGEVVLVHAVDTSPLFTAPEPFAMGPAPIVDAVAIAAKIRAGAAEALGAVAAEAGVARTEVLEGAPAASIVERARGLPADLVVLGTHGRSGVSRLFLGSVAERVVRLAPCDVLVVRAREAGANGGAEPGVSER
jgi:nucleotide-binding universal stress UspA family protein